MRIAFLSHEFPPATGGGGIGTYLAQVAPRLAALGHDVTVFAGTRRDSSHEETCVGARVLRVPCDDSPSFRSAVVPAFAAEHGRFAFDVCEGSDFDASALEVKRAFPRLPCVVKLHTPRFAIDELQHRPPGAFARLRMALGAWRRGQRLRIVPIRAQPDARAEIAALEIADEIAAPSRAIADAALRWARIDPRRISVFPYPYEPAPALLDLPVGSDTRRVTFLGRLEERKGVLDLAAAIPRVLAREPRCRFRFVGRAMSSPRRDLDMRAYLERRLSRFTPAVEFTGPRPPEDLPRLLADTDLLVAPSHWESFGLVCCEGMAAGRLVIGSLSGGMAEIIEPDVSGLLIPPGAPDDLADAILRGIADPYLRRRCGSAARERVLRVFAAPSLLDLQIASYQRACARLRAAYPHE